MAFRVNRTPIFTETVTLRWTEDGETIEESFDASFAVLGDDELDAFDTRTAEGQKGMLGRVLVHIGGLVEDDGQTPVAFDHAVRDRMLNRADLRLVLMRAWAQGIQRAAVGNSARQAAPGQTAH